VYPHTWIWITASTIGTPPFWQCSKCEARTMDRSSGGRCEHEK
jgi:hypothetical protein